RERLRLRARPPLRPGRADLRVQRRSAQPPLPSGQAVHGMGRHPAPARLAPVDHAQRPDLHPRPHAVSSLTRQPAPPRELTRAPVAGSDRPAAQRLNRRPPSPWETATMTDMVLPGVPFPLEPSGHPACQAVVSDGALILTGGAKSDLFIDPAGEEGARPDA